MRAVGAYVDPVVEAGDGAPWGAGAGAGAARAPGSDPPAVLGDDAAIGLEEANAHLEGARL